MVPPGRCDTYISTSHTEHALLINWCTALQARRPTPFLVSYASHLPLPLSRGFPPLYFYSSSICVGVSPSLLVFFPRSPLPRRIRSFPAVGCTIVSARSHHRRGLHHDRVSTVEKKINLCLSRRDATGHPALILSFSSPPPFPPSHTRARTAVLR